jgi:hypothetical protein
LNLRSVGACKATHRHTLLLHHFPIVGSERISSHPTSLVSIRVTAVTNMETQAWTTEDVESLHVTLTDCVVHGLPMPMRRFVTPYTLEEANAIIKALDQAIRFWHAEIKKYQKEQRGQQGMLQAYHDGIIGTLPDGGARLAQRIHDIPNNVIPSCHAHIYTLMRFHTYTTSVLKHLQQQERARQSQQSSPPPPPPSQSNQQSKQQRKQQSKQQQATIDWSAFLEEECF